MNFQWNPEKNETLKRERGIGFEEVVSAITEGQIIEIIPHLNQKKYPHQMMYVLNIRNYFYLVPFVENEQGAFLKTIIPSRKATRDYSGKKV